MGGLPTSSLTEVLHAFVPLFFVNTMVEVESITFL
jgi:hypothetical protein